MAKIDFKENGSKWLERSKNSAQKVKEKDQANFFEDVSIRPLDRLAHLIHEQSNGFSDHDLAGFNTTLECEVHQVRVLISTLCGTLEVAPCLDYGQEIDIQDLRQHYRDIFDALTIATNELSNFSDLGLVCAYAGNKIASRLSVLKGERS